MGPRAMPLMGLTRAGIISPIVAFLERVGAPVERLLARAGAPAWARTDPEMRIPTSSTVRLLAQAARAQGIENLGLKQPLHGLVEKINWDDIFAGLRLLIATFIVLPLL